MPNNITNKLTFEGKKEDVKALVEMFSTYYPSEPNMTYDNKEIYVKGREESKEYGWYDPVNKEFTTRDGNGGMLKFSEIQEGFVRDYESEYTRFPDFNKIIPQPDNIFNGSLGAAEEEMCKNEGRPNWFNWNRENWGTKWNSYFFGKESDNVYTFETAWNSVPHLIDVMSKKCPTVSIIYEYADEDTGYNCGYGIYRNGEITFVELEGGSRSAYDMAFKLNPEYKENYVLVNGNYIYKDIDDLEEE